ncbi:host attachment protein [Thalassovita aquimarina]|uniref:Host attachment protein n=1 Tax=Thalassovita aquimarina TaxID=2785917 RepID=A0ABS5HNL2_9RHOB|nr:host attachment family protein [Thalassovita aquimarina]MBR9650513.1 host attachment protein [Thalassovita aquimarina]
MKLEHGTWVVVADGQKYLLLRNNLDSKFIDLRVIGSEEIENPPAHEHSSDRSGRMHDAGPGGKSVWAETDWHQIEKERFARHLAEQLETFADKGLYEAVVIIADAHSLGQLRAAYGAKTKARLQGEIAKDLTNLSVDKIEAVVTAA